MSLELLAFSEDPACPSSPVVRYSYFYIGLFIMLTFLILLLLYVFYLNNSQMLRKGQLALKDRKNAERNSRFCLS